MFELFVIGGLVLAGVGVFVYKQKLAKDTPQILLTGKALLFAQLAPKISWCKYLEHIESTGYDLDQQFQELKKIYRVCVDVLQTKFNPSELTYKRYLNIVEATADMMLDNFNKCIPLLESLDQQKKAKREVSEDLSQRIGELIKFNQDSVEKLHQLSLNLSHIKSLEGQDQLTMDLLIKDLNVLIERAKDY